LKRLVVVGVGAGDPEQLTLQAIAALQEVDVVFVVEKGATAADFRRSREAICRRHITNRPYRFVEIEDARRDRDAPSYEASVRTWHDERALRYASAIQHELHDGECGAFLAWGDPAFYDSTLRVLDAVEASMGGALDYRVVPGVSSISALAAAHRIALNQVGRPVLLTTGRLFAEHGFPEAVDDVVVMLDDRAAFTTVVDPGVDIYWGANVGMPDEVLVAGPVCTVADEIVRRRAEVRRARGWVFDVYLLRRSVSTGRSPLRPT
jgi:precorrin-6A synthase